MIKLDERLKAVAESVPYCGTVADIGTDHGLLPCFLLLEGRAERTVISDISQKSLEKAKRRANSLGFFGKAAFYCTEGFLGIGEKIDCAVVAGMGAMEMISILRGAPPEVGFFVLQPMKNAPRLRKFLAENGFFIESDRKIHCKGKFYDIICARRGQDSLTKEELLFGRTNLKERGKAFLAYLEREREKACSILKRIGKADLRRRQLEEGLELIDGILNSD